MTAGLHLRVGGPVRLLGAAIAMAALLGVAAFILRMSQGSAVALVDPDDRAAVTRGAGIYAQHCAACHGANLEGQKNWQVVGGDGRLPAPPQDQRGHSWMHSDEELFHIVKFSLRDTAAPGYVSNMPAFDGALSDADMLAALAFIKSRWPIGVRAYQAALNPGARGMPAAAAGGDWKLPKDCGLEPVRLVKPRD